MPAIKDVFKNIYYTFPRPLAQKKLRQLDLPRFDFTLPLEEILELEAQRVSALAKGGGQHQKRTYSKGVLRYEKKRVPVKIKLSGSTVTHYFPEYYSFKVKFPKFQRIDNNRVLRFINPFDKYFDQVGNLFLKQFGHMSFRSYLALISLNGRELRPYQVLQVFKRAFTDDNLRTEGPVFKFSEPPKDFPHIGKSFEAINKCLKKNISEDCKANINWDLFDLKKMSKSLAFATLLGSFHGMSVANSYFYYDPALGKLEPVQWDDSFGKVEANSYWRPLGLMKVFLRNLEFREMFENDLELFSKKYVDEIKKLAVALYQKAKPVYEHDYRYFSNRGRDIYQNYIKTLDYNRPRVVGAIKKLYPKLIPSESPQPMKTYVIGPGEVDIEKPLVLPEGQDLLVKPGTNINLAPDTFILIQNADFVAEGTAKLPIVFRGKNWLSIAQIGNKKRVKTILRYVTIDGGNEAFVDHIRYSGALSVTNSDAIVENSNFTNSSGEDGINFKYSTVNMKNLVISSHFGDAIDLDFATAKLQSIEFTKTVEGDCLDTSGSNVTAESLTFSLCADKSISMGEATHAELSDVAISRSQIGIAVKDQSRVSLKDSTISNVHLGFAVYTKKYSFGPARLTLSNTEVKDYANRHSVEFRSELIDESR
jgi:hypothetical protein